jgi:hypothetical protein
VLEGRLAKPPLIDITTINSVESLFRVGHKDYQAARLAGNLADFFIYSETARYPNVITGSAATGQVDRFGAVPSLLRALMRRDSAVFSEETWHLPEQISVSPEYLDPAFESFHDYAINNRRRIRDLVLLHREPWIREQYSTRIATGYAYPVQTLRDSERLQALAHSLNVSEDEVCYVFDLVLRYGLYGELAGEGAYFLSHPVREQQNLPTMVREEEPPLRVPIRFGPSIARFAHELSQDEFTALLHEARGVVRDLRIVNLKPGAVDTETLREVAQRLALPARLKGTGRVLGVAAGAAGGAGAVPALGPVAALGGMAVSIASAFWTGRLPRAVSRARWLQWALEWDLEQESLDNRDPRATG